MGACLSLLCLVFLVLLLLASLVDGVPRGGRVPLTTSMAEWKVEGDDAPGGGPDPSVSLLLLRREKVSAWRHVDGLGGHLGEVVEPRLLGPVRCDYRRCRPRLPKLGCQVVEQLPWGVAPIFFYSSVPVWEVEGVHSFRGAVPPLGVVAGDLLAGGGRKPVDGVEAPNAVEVLELAWG